MYETKVKREQSKLGMYQLADSEQRVDWNQVNMFVRVIYQESQSSSNSIQLIKLLEAVIAQLSDDCEYVMTETRAYLKWIGSQDLTGGKYKEVSPKINDFQNWQSQELKRVWESRTITNKLKELLPQARAVIQAA